MTSVKYTVNYCHPTFKQKSLILNSFQFQRELWFVTHHILAGSLRRLSQKARMIKARWKNILHTKKSNVQGGGTGDRITKQINSYKTSNDSIFFFLTRNSIEFRLLLTYISSPKSPGQSETRVRWYKHCYRSDWILNLRYDTKNLGKHQPLPYYFCHGSSHFRLFFSSFWGFHSSSKNILFSSVLSTLWPSSSSSIAQMQHILVLLFLARLFF
jgi:hypothetical protein